MKYDPVHNKNPNVTDAQRKARKELLNMMLDGEEPPTEEELDAVRRELYGENYKEK